METIHKITQSSYEFGRLTSKEASRHKIYYDEPKELKEKINQLKELGLIDEFDGEGGI